MQRYLALLRGINVGGNGRVNMSELKTALEACGLRDVRTYIQSGNVFFSSPATDTLALAETLQLCLARKIHVASRAVVFTHMQWQAIIESAPAWWGKDPARKHNLLALLSPHDMTEVATAIGTIKPDVEAMEPGEGVLYQSMAKTLIGRTTTGKLPSSPLYKEMTVRSYNTATKLLKLF